MEANEFKKALSEVLDSLEVQVEYSKFWRRVKKYTFSIVPKIDPSVGPPVDPPVDPPVEPPVEPPIA